MAKVVWARGGRCMKVGGYERGLKGGMPSR